MNDEVPYIRITTPDFIGCKTKVEAVLKDGSVVDLGGFTQRVTLEIGVEELNKCTLVCPVSKAQEVKALLSETEVKFMDEEPVEITDGFKVHHE